jgi:hypothetical protein
VCEIAEHMDMHVFVSPGGADTLVCMRDCVSECLYAINVKYE